MLADRLSTASQRSVSRETASKIETYVDALLVHNSEQNLISRSSESDVLNRHILDGAQLLQYDQRRDAHWIDIGTGPGLPGLIIAAIHEGPVTLIEPRTLRVAFLRDMVTLMGIGDRVAIVPTKAVHFEGRGEVITGRAVAKLDRFLELSHHLSTEKTRWILPKGKNAPAELEQARKLWHLDARVEDSLTDAAAKIVVIDKAKRRGRP